MINLGQVKQSDSILKFLGLTTLLFIVITGIIFWQQREEVNLPVVDEERVKHFSDRKEESSLVETYLYGARYIHDIEAYPEIKDLFFNTSFPQLTDKNKIDEALAEVKAEKALLDDFAKTHVYSTSYYIGNLLISPDLTLHAVLADGGKPNTSILLTSALSDVRSGVVKVQNYYDVAPPFYYDEAYAGAVYFPAASFPSLTVAEAGIVLYLMAEIDPINARPYEQFLLQYANQALASGANFYIDIDYALKLASVYHGIIKNKPEYKNLVEQAKEEWKDTKKISLTDYFKIKFPLNKFPYESHFEILKPTINIYKSQKSDEKISGEIKLSLVDNRLPDSFGRLYSYNLNDDSLLPFAIDLYGRKYSLLEEVVTSFAGISQDKYFFVSGIKPRASESGTTFFAHSQIFYKTGESVLPLDTNLTKSRYVQTNLKLSLDQDRLLYNQFLLEQKENPDSWDIKLDKLMQGKLLNSELIARGASPVLVLAGEAVLFWRENSIWQININSGLEQKVITFPEQKGLSKVVNLDYLEDTKTLVVSHTYLELNTLVPRTELFIYKLEKSEDGDLLVKKTYEFEIEDATVVSVKQSPGGSYLAMLVNESIGEREAKLLIFNINSGIIQKDLDLLPYSHKAMMIDGWLVGD